MRVVHDGNYFDFRVSKPEGTGHHGTVLDPQRSPEVVVLRIGGGTPFRSRTLDKPMVPTCHSLPARPVDISGAIAKITVSDDLDQRSWSLLVTMLPETTDGRLNRGAPRKMSSGRTAATQEKNRLCYQLFNAVF